MDLSQIHSPLLIWYRNNQRNLPWRLSPNAYSVWISEIILQQTRVEQGRAYYEKIISRVPNVCDMAKLEEEEMLFLWQGLGYYSRARNMLSHC